MSATGLPAITRRVLGLLTNNRAALAALVVRSAGVIAGFALTFLIARWFGPEANGIYALVTQSAIFLSIVAVGGLDLAIVREFSRSVATGLPLARKAVWGVLVQTGGLSLVIGLVILIFERELVPRLLGSETVQHGASILVGLILIRALMRILSAILRSQARYSAGQVIELFLLPALTIALLAGLWNREQGIEGILFASVLAGGVVVLLGLLLVLKDTSTSDQAIRTSQVGLLIGALPMWGMAISQNLADWYGLVSLNQWGGAAETGIYRVSWQIASVIPLVSVSLLGTYTAQIASAVHADDRPQMARLARTATRLSLLIFGPVAAALVLLAEPILGVFGSEFVSGAPTLRALVAGHLIVAVFGISGQILVMIGHARFNLIANLVSIFVILLAAPVAAKMAGGMGIALLFGALNVGKITIFLFAISRLEKFNAITGKLHQLG